MTCIWSSTTICVLPERSRQTFLYSNTSGNLHCMTGVGNLSVNKIKTQIRQKQNVSFREMQMKLWGIKKWMLLKNIGKNVTRKSTIFDIKNILVIYDLWFHSDKKIKNRYLNDELIWERTINTTESKASKKNPFSFSHVYEGPAWCGFMYNSWNRCSFSLLLNGSNRKGNDPPKSTQ